MSETTTPATDPFPIACSLDEGGLAKRSQALARDLFGRAERVEELADGYAWRFPGDDAWKTKLLEFVAAERRCCSFFRIELAFEPRLGPIWLRLTGPDGVKDFIREVFDAR